MSKILVTNINDLSDNASLITQSGGIKSDKLTGVTTAGSISVTGDGNSTTTNLQQGLAKHWARVNQISSNVLGSTFNNSSATDVGTGQVRFHRTSNLANDDYPPFMSTEVQSSYTNVGNSTLSSSTQLSTTFMSAYHVENGSATDTALLTMVALGDLA